MTVRELPLFSAAALAVLDRMPFDPQARGQFEYMSGALLWPDEFPRPGTADWEAVSPNWVYRYLLAYRASITLGRERPEFKAVWEQVAAHARNWPGLRPERRDDRARHRLLAGLRRQERCLADLDDDESAGRPAAD